MPTIQQLKLILRSEFNLSDEQVRQFGKLIYKSTWEAALVSVIEQATASAKDAYSLKTLTTVLATSVRSSCLGKESLDSEIERQRRKIWLDSLEFRSHHVLSSIIFINLLQRFPFPQDYCQKLACINYSSLLMVQRFVCNCYQIFRDLKVSTDEVKLLAESVKSYLKPRHHLPYWLMPKNIAITKAILESENWHASFSGAVKDLRFYWGGFPESRSWVSLGEGWKYNNDIDFPTLIIDNAVFCIDPGSFDRNNEQMYCQLKSLIQVTTKNF